MLAVERAALPKAAGIYCRLSYAPDGSVENVERQEQACRELAARLGWPISESHVFVDNSRSAWQRNRKRPRWDTLLGAIEGAEIDGLLIYHGDRLIRQPWDLEKMISVADAGLRIASPQGTRSLDSAEDRFILRIEAAQACRESDNISRRVRAHRTASAKKGRRPGGARYRPFGYGVETGQTRRKWDRTAQEYVSVPELDLDQVRPDEAKLLAEAVERIFAGQSPYAAHQWIRSKCLATSGKPWSRQGFKVMMRSPRIAGLIEHEGTLYKASWPAIIAPEDWEDLQALLNQRAQGYGRSDGRKKYLLSGIAECGRGCEGRMNRGTGGRLRDSVSGEWVYRLVYKCEVCGLGRDIRYVDAYLVGRTLRVLNDDRLLAELGGPGGKDRELSRAITKLEFRRRTLRERVENAADDLEFDPVLAMTTLASYDRRLREMRELLATTAQQRIVARMIGISAEAWEAEPLDARAAVVEALWRVVILPTDRRGPGFDPEAVKLIRRRLVGQQAAVGAVVVPSGG